MTASLATGEYGYALGSFRRMLEAGAVDVLQADDYSQCDNDRANIAAAKATLTTILQAAGAQDILTIDRCAHLVGGCRMGIGPEDSVLDADHRVWGVPNLFVCDGSVMATQGAANPALTIMALASRLGELLAAKRIDPACEQVAA